MGVKFDLNPEWPATGCLHTGYVTLSISLSFSVPQFPPMEIERNNCIQITGLFQVC